MKNKYLIKELWQKYNPLAQVVSDQAASFNQNQVRIFFLKETFVLEESAQGATLIIAEGMKVFVIESNCKDEESDSNLAVGMVEYKLGDAQRDTL